MDNMTCEFCHNEIELQDRAFFVQTAQEEAACCSACLGALAEECWTLQFKVWVGRTAPVVFGAPNTLCAHVDQ